MIILCKETPELEQLEKGIMQRLHDFLPNMIDDILVVLNGDFDIDYRILPNDVIEDQITKYSQEKLEDLHLEISNRSDSRLINLEAYIFQLICNKKQSDKRVELQSPKNTPEYELIKKQESAWAISTLYKARLIKCQQIYTLKQEWLNIDNIIQQGDDIAHHDLSETSVNLPATKLAD